MRDRIIRIVIAKEHDGFVVTATTETLFEFYNVKVESPVSEARRIAEVIQKRYIKNNVVYITDLTK